MHRLALYSKEDAARVKQAIADFETTSSWAKPVTLFLGLFAVVGILYNGHG